MNTQYPLYLTLRQVSKTHVGSSTYRKAKNLQATSQHSTRQLACHDCLLAKPYTSFPLKKNHHTPVSVSASRAFSDRVL